MLKKAGIIVAASAAGLLAMSPLAFASPDGHDGGDRGHSDSRGDHKGQDRGGDRIDFTQVQVQEQEENRFCGNQANTGTNSGGVESGLTTLLGVVVPINGINASPCINGDVLDLSDDNESQNIGR